jgi:hypothetical protein
MSTSSHLAPLFDDQHLSTHLVTVLLPMDVAPEYLVQVLELLRVLRDIERQPDNLRGINPNPCSVRQFYKRTAPIEPKWDIEKHGGHELMRHIVFVPEDDVCSCTSQKHKSFCGLAFGNAERLIAHDHFGVCLDLL